VRPFSKQPLPTTTPEEDGALSMIVAFAECTCRAEIEECTREFYSTGNYERIQYQDEKPQ